MSQPADEILHETSSIFNTFRYRGKTARDRFFEKINKLGRQMPHVPELGCCWEWTGKNVVDGYGRLGTRNKAYLAHRFCWAACVGEIPEEMQVLHKCDNRLCVRPSHLFLGTNLENVRDKESKGRGCQPFGERHANAKFKESDILKIRKLISEGVSCLKISKIYNVSSVTIDYINHRKTWRHTI